MIGGFAGEDGVGVGGGGVAEGNGPGQHLEKQPLRSRMEKTDGHLTIRPADPPPRTAARPADRPLRREVTLPGELRDSDPELHPNPQNPSRLSRVNKTATGPPESLPCTPTRRGPRMPH